MGILGLLLGAALVTVIRTLQGLEPVQDTGLSLTLGGFTAVGFFLWGLGAFDPRMSEHAHDPEHAEQLALALAEEEANAPPPTILGGYIWLLMTGLLVLLLVIAAFALIPGSPALQTTSDPLGNTAANGFVEVQLLGHTLIVSQLLLLIGFVAAMFLTLTLVAGALGFIFFALNRGVAEVATVPRTALGPGPLPAKPEQPAADRPLTRVPGRAFGWALGTLGAVVVLDLTIPFEPGLRVPSFSYILVSLGLLAVLTLIGWAVLSALLRLVRGWLWLVRALITLAVVGAFTALYAALVTGPLLALDWLPLVVINALPLALAALGGGLRGVQFVLLGAGLFVAFYYVLIGLVLVGAPDTLYWLSLLNAVVIALVALWPRQVTNAVGSGARGLARWLRRLPYWISG